MYIEPEIKDWMPLGITEDEFIAAIRELNRAATSVEEIVNEINEEAVYESKWRKSE